MNEDEKAFFYKRDRVSLQSEKKKEKTVET